MNAKFWAINCIAFLIVIVYSISWYVMSVVQGLPMNPFWEASPFQLVFIIAFLYLVGEGKLIQKILLAKRLKEDGTKEEFAIVNKSANNFDKMLLDKIKKD